MSDPIVSFVTTTSNKLGCAESVPVVPGQLIVATDTETMYFDKPGATDISQRIAITDVVVCDTTLDAPIAPLDKFYLFKNKPNSLYYYFEGEWNELTEAVLPGLKYITCVDSEGKLHRKLTIDYNHSLCIDAGLKLGVRLSNATGNNLSLTSDGIFGKSTIVTAGGGGIKVKEDSDSDCTIYTVSFNQSGLLDNIRTETPLSAPPATEFGVKTISLNYDERCGLMKLSDYRESAVSPACIDKLMLHVSDDDFLFEICKETVRKGRGQLMLKYQPCDNMTGNYGYLAKVDNEELVKPGTLGVQLAKTLDDDVLEGVSEHPIYPVIKEAKQLLSGYVRDTSMDTEDEDAEYRQSGLAAFVNTDTGLLVHDFMPADAGSTTGEDGCIDVICSKIVSLSLLQDSSGVKDKYNGDFDHLKPALAVGYQSKSDCTIPGVGVLVAKSGSLGGNREFTNVLGFEGGTGIDVDCSGLHVIVENGCSGLAYNDSFSDRTIPYGMYVNISTCSDNILQRLDDGLYVNANCASGGGTTYTGEEPITISTDNVIGLCYNEAHMSVCSGKLQVNISACVDNSLEVKNDGLYVPTSCSSGGLQNLATGTNSLSILGQATTSDYSTSVGSNANASAPYATALGRNATASGNYAAALGYCATASGNTSIAIGYYATASNTASTALGYKAIASGSLATALGFCACASGGCSTALGYGAKASGALSTALGSGSCADYYATVIGYGSCAYCSGVAIGYDSFTNSEGVAIGRCSIVNDTKGVAIGTYSSTQCNSVAIGVNAQVCGVNAVAIGYEAQNSVDQSILLSTEKYGVHFRCDCAGLGPGIEYRVGAICQDEVYGYMPFARSSGSSYTATAPILIDTSANDISLCYSPCSFELCSSELRVRVSSTSGNALSILGDGLYVCSGGGGGEVSLCGASGLYFDEGGRVAIKYRDCAAIKADEYGVYLAVCGCSAIKENGDGIYLAICTTSGLSIQNGELVASGGGGGDISLSCGLAFNDSRELYVNVDNGCGGIYYDDDGSLMLKVCTASGLSIDNDGYLVSTGGGGSGLQNTATGTNSLTVLGVSSSYNCSINIGYNSKVTGLYGTTLGVCSCSAAYGTSMGYKSCSALCSVSVGYNSCACSSGISVGYGSRSYLRGVAIGTTSCSYDNGVAVGDNSATRGGPAVAIGASASADDGGIAIGYGVYATCNTINIGSNTCGTDSNRILIGIGSDTTSTGIAIGTNATSMGGCGPGGITIGSNSTGGTGIVIGHNSSADCGAYGFVAIGDCASSSGNHNVAIGLCSTAYNSSVAIGPFSGCASQPGSIHIKAGSCSTRYKDSSGDNIRLQTDSLDMYFHGDYIEGCNPGFFYKTRYGTSGHIAFDDMGSGGGGGGGGPYLPISGGTVTDNFSVLPLGCTTALGAPAYGLHVSSCGGLQLFGTHFLQGTLWSNDGLKIVSNNLSLTTLDEAYISSDYANTTTFRAMPNDGSQATYKFEAWGWTDSSHTSKSPSLGVRLLKPSQKTPLEATSVLNMEEGDARWGGSSTLKLCSKMLYFDTSGYLCVRLSSNPMNELEFLDDGLYHCGLPY